MHLQINLSDEMAARLQAESARTGKPLKFLILEAAEEKLDANKELPQIPYGEWRIKFEKLLATMPKGNPHAEFDRENIYEGRGE